MFGRFLNTPLSLTSNKSKIKREISGRKFCLFDVFSFILLFIYFSLCIFLFSLSIHLSICLSVCVSFYRLEFLYLRICLFLCLHAYPYHAYPYPSILSLPILHFCLLYTCPSFCSPIFLFCWIYVFLRCMIFLSIAKTLFIVYTPGFKWEKDCQFSKSRQNQTCLKFSPRAHLSSDVECLTKCHLNKIEKRDEIIKDKRATQVSLLRLQI